MSGTIAAMRDGYPAKQPRGPFTLDPDGKCRNAQGQEAISWEDWKALEERRYGWFAPHVDRFDGSYYERPRDLSA